MKNNTVGKVAIKTSRLPLARHNLSHDVSSTFSFGDLQPTLVRWCPPDSVNPISADYLIRPMPLAAPCFGRLRFKNFAQFVPMTDVMPNYNEMMAQTRYTYGANTYVPKCKPQLPLGVLSLMCLAGAKVSIYGVDTPTLGKIRYNAYEGDTDHIFPNSGPLGHLLNVISDAVGSGWYNANYAFDWRDFLGGGYTTLGLRLDAICSQNVYNNLVANDPYHRFTQFFNKFIPMDFSFKTFGFNYDTKECAVSIDGADYIIQREWQGSDGTNHSWAFAFKLSSFGKRIRKAILGAGYQINFDSLTYLDITPLTAIYKAYFDFFGLLQWKNFEDTYTGKFIQRWCTNSYNRENVMMTSDFYDIIFNVFTEIGSMWFTDAQDFVSVHMPSVTGNVKSNDESFLDVDPLYGNDVGSTSSVISGNTNGLESDVNKNRHQYIDRLEHSWIDDEALKRFYKVTNQQSILGQRLKELLIARGLQDFVDECKSTFIGQFESPIVINDVVALSDTYNKSTNEGAILGEYGGRGICRDSSKNLSYKNNEAGYLIVLSTIVPEAGFCQAIDGNLLATDKATSYNPEYDGLGMEANPKLLVVADENISRSNNTQSNTLDSNFGFVPRCTRFKFKPNVMNGDFSLRSSRKNWLPFTLDRFIEINKLNNGSKYEDPLDTSTIAYNYDLDGLIPDTLPIAGDIWRYVSRYGYLGNFYRIFALIGDTDQNPEIFESSKVFELCHSSIDQFMLNLIWNYPQMARMLPLEKSYETTDDSNRGSTDYSVAKS